MLEANEVEQVLKDLKDYPVGIPGSCWGHGPMEDRGSPGCYPDNIRAKYG